MPRPESIIPIGIIPADMQDVKALLYGSDFKAYKPIALKAVVGEGFKIVAEGNRNTSTKFKPTEGFPPYSIDMLLLDGKINFWDYLVAVREEIHGERQPEDQKAEIVTPRVQKEGFLPKLKRLLGR